MSAPDFHAFSRMAALTAVLLSSSAVFAQEASSTEDQTGIEDIVVTARKTEERLQDVPIAISAFSGEALEQRGSASVSDISTSVPNVSISPIAPVGGSTTAAVFFIRGVGQTDFAPTTDPGVGLYVDGVYVARSVGSLLDLVDVDRVEVLRGPQGTLFGKNTIGGAISITSREPGQDFVGQISLKTGSFRRMEGQMSASGPVSDTLSAGFAVQYRNSRGYVRRLIDNVRLGGDDKLSARAQIVWKPNDAFKLRIVGDMTHVSEESAPNVLLLADGTAQFAALWNLFAVPGCAPPPGPRTNPACFNSQWVTGNPYTTFATKPSASNADVYGISGTAEVNGDWGAIKSITAYRNTKANFSRDSDGSPLPIFETDDTISQSQFSQELQYTGSFFADRFKLVTGAYYFEEQGDNVNNVTVSIVAGRSGGRIDNRSWAVYGQGTFNITDALSITGGIRYNDERKSFLPDQFYTRPFPIPNPAGGPPLAVLAPGTRIVPFVTKTIRAKEWTPTASISYKFSDDVLAYVSYSKGFKGGGFVQRNFLPLTEVPSYNPEFVNSYEIGLKTDLFDKRVRFNAAAFKVDYSDIQVTVLDGVAPQVRNAASARINGFEGELTIAPSRAFMLTGSLGYVDAKYTQIGPRAIEITLAKKFPFISKWNASIGAQYNIDAGFGTISPRVDWSYRSKFFFDAANVPVASQNGYSLVNASLSVTTNDDLWRFVLGTTNLTNKRYLLSAYPSVGQSGYVEGAYARPREWSLKATRKF